MLIKVSIVVPVYNTDSFLEKCLDSIVNQTLQEIEVILIDDGSKDNSLKICTEYQKKDSRIKVFAIPNSGVSVARNIGLDHAAGEYIGFVDSDDWIEKEMFETLFRKATETNSDLVSCNFVKYFTDREIKNFYKNKFACGFYDAESIKQNIFPDLICSNKLKYKPITTLVTKIFRRNLLIDHNIRFAEKLYLGGQDTAFTVTAMLFAHAIYYMPEEYLYHYNMGNPISQTKSPKYNWEMHKRRNDYFREIADSYKGYDFSKQVRFELLNSAVRTVNRETKTNTGGFLKCYGKIVKICADLKDYNDFPELDYHNMDKQKKEILYSLRKRKILVFVARKYFKNFSRRFKKRIKKIAFLSCDIYLS